MSRHYYQSRAASGTSAPSGLIHQANEQALLRDTEPPGQFSRLIHQANEQALLESIGKQLDDIVRVQFLARILIQIRIQIIVIHQVQLIGSEKLLSLFQSQQFDVQRHA